MTVPQRPQAPSPTTTAGDGAQSPYSRIIQPRVNACDGWPRCRYEGTGRELREHRRHCGFSDDGAIWRLFHHPEAGL